LKQQIRSPFPELSTFRVPFRPCSWPALAAALGAALVVTLGALVRLHGTGRRQARRISELSHLALVDGLTGLRNRRAFDEELGRALGARQRHVVPDRLAIAMVDVRGLKDLNDSLGHQAGDERLIRLAEVLRVQVRESDSLYRIGGDEFMVILPGQGAGEARKLIRRLQAALEADGIHVSAGVAEATGAVTANVLIRRADRGLRAAKRGPGSVVVWSPGLDRVAGEASDASVAPSDG
jgi:diguanylate cyclase (GGDEF)-like protein